MSTLWGIFSTMKTHPIRKKIMVQKTLSLVLDEVINETTSTLKGSQVSFN